MPKVINYLRETLTRVNHTRTRPYINTLVLHVQIYTSSSLCGSGHASSRFHRLARARTLTSQIFTRGQQNRKKARAPQIRIARNGFCASSPTYLPAYVHSNGHFRGPYCHGFVFLRVCVAKVKDQKGVLQNELELHESSNMGEPCLQRLSKILLHLVALSYSLCCSWCWNELCDYIVWCLYVHIQVYVCVFHLTFIYVFPLQCLLSSFRCTFIFSITDNNVLARVLFIYILCM